jgi:arabinofuranosyltransferase
VPRRLPSHGAPLATLAVVGVAAIALYFGWRAFWFLCDDAYIVFRYASNSQLGYGYVWNPPPFLPVEGYTCFLWVVLLDVVWTLTGVEPPASSNWLALGFGFGSLGLTAGMLLKLELGPSLAVLRRSLLAIVLLGVATNACFLTWTSSGLETSLFNFLMLAWVGSALFLPVGSAKWVFAVSATAGLLTLTRPDGLTMFAFSVLAIANAAVSLRPRLPLRRLLLTFPLAFPVGHMLWRRSFYGEWLPNTYYAKHVAAWPESGVRYLGSFVLEYGLWLWGLLFVGWLVSELRSRSAADRRLLVDVELRTRALVLGGLALQFSYYTFVIGGDHFEYRIYSHLPPLWLVGGCWMLNRLVERTACTPRVALGVLGLIVALSWPIPWHTWWKSRSLETRADTFSLTIPMAQAFPAGLRWYGRWFDALQHWLIVEHAVGKRHREHQVFHRHQRKSFAGPRQSADRFAKGHPVMAANAVGVVGWVVARASVIDTRGLNDYVIARSGVPAQSERRMAHDREPPPGYVPCFRPNLRGDSFRHAPARAVPLEAREIQRCEQRYRNQLRSQLRDQLRSQLGAPEPAVAAPRRPTSPVQASRGG